MSTNPLLARAHLEAVLLARLMLRPGFSRYVDKRCLSPAAFTLCRAARVAPDLALSSGLLAAVDAIEQPPEDDESKRFCIRMAERVEKLTVREIGFFTLVELVTFVNALPKMRTTADVVDHEPLVVSR